MGLVKIKRGKSVYEVSTGAYENIYKKQGFKKVSGGHEAANEEPETVEPGVTIPDDVNSLNGPNTAPDEFADLREKPISKWSKEECIAFAEANELDITGMSGKQVKEYIKEYLEEGDSEE